MLLDDTLKAFWFSFEVFPFPSLQSLSISWFAHCSDLGTCFAALNAILLHWIPFYRIEHYFAALDIILLHWTLFSRAGQYFVAMDNILLQMTLICCIEHYFAALDTILLQWKLFVALNTILPH